MNKCKFVFIGTGNFAAIILTELVKNHYQPLLVVTSPDKKVGRQQLISPSPVKEVAQKHRLEILQPLKINKIYSKIKKLSLDLIIVTDYKQIIPSDILKIPSKSSLNIHPSLLPLYRGPSPIQEVILKDEKKTGVTIIEMDEKIDHGPIVAQEKIKIQNPKITYPELNETLAILGAKLLLKTIPLYLTGKIKSRPQDEKRATYTKLITKNDGRIIWSETAKFIERKIRAYYPWPGTYTFWQGKLLKILEGEIYPNNFRLEPGRVFKTEMGEIAVATSEKSLIIKKLQLEGKNPTSGLSFLQGYPQIIGSILDH